MPSVSAHLQAQAELVGLTAIERGLLEQAKQDLPVSYFTHAKLKQCYRILMRSLYNKTDPHTLSALLQAAEELKLSEPKAYVKWIIKCMEATISVSERAFHSAIQILKKEHTRKLLLKLLEEASLELQSKEENRDYRKTLLRAIERLEEREGGNEEDVVCLLKKQFLEDYVHDRVNFGIASLDEKIGGIRKSTLNIIGGYTKIGKTSFALSSALDMLRKGRKLMFYTAEMSREELALRLLSLIQEMRIGDLLRDKESFQQALSVFEKLPLHIVKGSSVASLMSWTYTHPETEVLFVDYLQILYSGQKYDSRQAEIASITRKLKQLAQERNIVVFALSQLNRTAAREKPQLYHLRESGAIEADADLVLLLSRPKRDEEIATIQIAANRHGRTDEVEVAWDGQLVRFRDRAENCGGTIDLDEELDKEELV